MSYAIVGAITKLPYVEGTKAECFRKMNEEHPYFVEDVNHKNGRRMVDRVYKEPLVLIKQGETMKLLNLNLNQEAE